MLYQPYKKFIEARLTIVNKSQAEQPFILNSVQDRFVQEASGKDIILKARQQGFSSLILGAFTGDFLLKENSLSVVVADISDNANDLLARVKWYIKSYEEKTNSKVPLKYNSKRELHNAANNARYIIGTAENTDFGRSKTITNLHLSEAFFYPKFRELLAGVSSAVVPEGKIVIESTANGFNDGKAFYDESVLGQTGYKAHFFPAQDFYSEDFLKEREQSLGRLFKQEYPRTALEAFLTSGATYFDSEAMQTYMNMAREPINV